MAFDGLRDRWERMAPRERKLVTLLGVTFVVCIIGWVGLTVTDGLDAIEKRNRQARAALSALETYRASGAGRAGREAAVEIPPQPIELSTYLDEVVREIQAQSPAYPSPKQTERGKYVESAMRVTLKDLTIFQVKDLLEKLESKSKVVVIRELKVKRSFRDREKLDVDLSLSTFHEPGKAAPEAQGEAAAAAPGEPGAGGER
jgi:type II secretory pathway component PulM